jgi:hypothetical protein
MKKLNEIQRELSAPKNQYNKFGDYKYRSCEDIQEAVKPLLGDAILTISDEIVVLGIPLIGTITTTAKNGSTIEKQVDVGSRFYVKATATIKCGEESESATALARESFNKKGMDESQITCAASSYARKYALGGLFAIDDGQDADSINDKSDEGATPKETNYFEQLTTYCNKEGVKIKEQDVINILAEHGITDGQALQKKTAPKALELIKSTLEKGE